MTNITDRQIARLYAESWLKGDELGAAVCESALHLTLDLDWFDLTDDERAAISNLTQEQARASCARMLGL